MNVPIKSIRVIVDDEIREKRGWIFQNGIDDVASECNLDGYENWDYTINNNTGSAVESLSEVIDFIKSKLGMWYKWTSLIRPFHLNLQWLNGMALNNYKRVLLLSIKIMCRERAGRSGTLFIWYKNQMISLRVLYKL